MELVNCHILKQASWYGALYDKNIRSKLDLETNMQDGYSKVNCVLLLSLLLLLKWAISVASEEHFGITNFKT